VFYRAARANTLTWLINDALSGRGRYRIEVGIGLDYGQLININTGSGQTPEPPTYPGEPITRAEDLAGKAGRLNPIPIWYSVDYVTHLDQREQGLLTDPFPDVDRGGRIYTGNPIDHDMFEWIEDRASHRRTQNWAPGFAVDRDQAPRRFLNLHHSSAMGPTTADQTVGTIRRSRLWVTSIATVPTTAKTTNVRPITKADRTTRWSYSRSCFFQSCPITPR
jgi:hypothetical protein